jgi:hypothetical protein
MDASTIRHAADTVTDKLAPVTETVVDKLAPVGETVADKLGDLGDAAHRLAALTPWVEPRTNRTFRTWALRIGALLAMGGVAWWWAKRRTTEAGAEPQSTFEAPPRTAERRLTAAAGD